MMRPIPQRARHGVGKTVMRAALVIAIALTLIVSPWAPALLPGPADRLGTAPANAQPPASIDPNDCARVGIGGDNDYTPPDLGETYLGVICGTPRNCPVGDDWTVFDHDTSLCYRDRPPCPVQWPLSDIFVTIKNNLATDQNIDVTTPQDYGEDRRTTEDRGTRYSVEFFSMCEDTIREEDIVRAYQDAHMSMDHDVIAEIANTAIERCLKIPTEESDYEGIGPVGFIARGSNADHDTNGHCRILIPARCEDGMHRVSHDRCEQFQRRTWTCAENYISRNQFNTCFPDPDAPGAESAPDAPDPCVKDAPLFAISRCADYVGNDFERNPEAVMCADYIDGNVVDAAFELEDYSADNMYWCKFRGSALATACHRDGANGSSGCSKTAPPNAVCIKRLSKSGGCDAIAATINCRKLQADYRKESDTDLIATALENILQNKCMPCTALPFSSLPAECPARSIDDLKSWETDDEARLGLLGIDADAKNKFDVTHAVQGSFFWGLSNFNQACNVVTVEKIPLTDDRAQDCAKQLTCSKPPQGRIVADIAHSSGLSLVNAPVVVNIADIPVRGRTYRRLFFNSPTQPLVKNVTVMSYYDGNADDNPLMWTWPEITAERKARTFFDLMRNDTTQGDCIVETPPAFRLVVKELLPLEDEGEIKELFGEKVLQWWEIRTEGLTEEGKRALSPRRDPSTLVTEIECNYGANVWCIWVPLRPGYYRLEAAAAWEMQRTTAARKWWSDGDLNRISNYLTNTVIGRNTNSADVSGERIDFTGCQSYDDLHVNTKRKFQLMDQDCLDEIVRQADLTPEDIGVNPGDPGDEKWSGLQPIDGSMNNADYLYTYDGARKFHCLSPDLRVTCSGGNEHVSYTVTEPIGIVVHEARVVTRPVTAP